MEPKIVCTQLEENQWFSILKNTTDSFNNILTKYGHLVTFFFSIVCVEFNFWADENGTSRVRTP